MLELDRAGRLAVAARRAGPQRVLADHGIDERRQRLRGGTTCDDGLALLEQMMLEPVVHPFERQRLAGEERGARVLAAAALGAGEGVEAVLPRQILRGTHADLHLGVVGAVGHDRFEVDGRHRIGRPAPPEKERGQRGHDVEVLAQRQDHQEREHHDELGPIEELVPDRECSRRETGEQRRHAAADEGVVALVGDRRVARREQREAEAVEQEVGDHDRGDERQDQQRFPVGLEPLRRSHVAAVERVGERAPAPRPPRRP